METYSPFLCLMEHCSDRLRPQIPSTQIKKRLTIFKRKIGFGYIKTILLTNFLNYTEMCNLIDISFILCYNIYRK